MAPKRTQKLVVQTTRKVVQESVQVSVPVVGSSKRSTRGNNKEEHARTIPIEEVTPQAARSQAQAPEDGQNDQVQETKKEVPTKTKSQEKKRKRGSRVGEHYQRYVYRVLKQVHPDMGISSKAMTILNNLMTDMFERLAEEAARLNKYTGHMTLSSREIQGTVKLVLPGELGKHALAEGAKAVTTYLSNHRRC
ncbi:hypothetical protein L6164_019025 [Bauhinia variegata]|uniref:Uncharacterized protein n=1 Tax=Bauhinia variegata TaxID=167791 RepID=A0ACB9NER2_BAUVA|nr:hypothetical protein L6164_019025 [Bauhinia variegata]